MTSKQGIAAILATFLAGVIIYTVGYCRGDAHGETSVQAKALAARVDSLWRKADSLAVAARHDQYALDSAHTRTIQDSVRLAHVQEHVRVIDKTHVEIRDVVTGTPRMETIPVEVADFLQAQAQRIASLERALNAAYILIDTQRQQLAATSQRAAALDSLYHIEKAKHSGPGFTVGLLTGGLLGLLGLIFAH